ncbi:MAG: hypothetical protein F4Y18_03510 [Cenarchaeum sp. SB0663_bin_5]|nr:hypothetical protein [Cenarchaeum sp. SB0663_bin_5]
MAKTDNFPWKDIKGIRLYGTSKDFPQPPDRPTPFDIKCPAYTQDPDEEQAQEIPEHKPMQYLTYDQDQRLDIIQQDISFQLEGVTAPDTITEPYAEIQDLTTQLNKLRNYIPNEILQVIQSETYKQEYVITQHNTETDNLDYYRFYHRRPPPAGAFDPPESVKPYLDDFIYIYNTLQYAKRRLRERHNYTGTFRFLRFFIVAMSEPAHHAKSKRRIESHYYEYYRMTGRDPDKDGIPYRMLVAMSCVDNDPTAGQNHIDPHIQQTLI